MKNHDGPGFWHRLGNTLKRGILGKSGHDTGNRDGYWDRVITAQRGQPEKGTSVECSTDHEPVHGWTRRQCDEYLTRNPDYRLAYDTELKKRAQTTIHARGRN